MVRDVINDLGSAGGDFLIRLGQIALVAIVYFAIAYLVIRVVIKRMKNSPVLTKYGKNGSMIAFRLISVVVYLVAVIGILSYAGVNTSGILTLASAFTVAIGLALQDVMRNLISGIFMLAEKPFNVGDRVMVRDRVGTVQGIDIRTTLLRTDDGALLMVPNSLMFTEILQNNTRYNMRMIRYNITTPLPPDKLMIVLDDIATTIESIRPPVNAPLLVQHEEGSTMWEVSFAVNAKQMSHDHEIGEALLEAIPDATIARAS